MPSANMDDIPGRHRSLAPRDDHPQRTRFGEARSSTGEGLLRQHDAHLTPDRGAMGREVRGERSPPDRIVKLRPPPGHLVEQRLEERVTIDLDASRLFEERRAHLVCGGTGPPHVDADPDNDDRGPRRTFGTRRFSLREDPPQLAIIYHEVVRPLDPYLDPAVLGASRDCGQCRERCDEVEIARCQDGTHQGRHQQARSRLRLPTAPQPPSSGSLMEGHDDQSLRRPAARFAEEPVVGRVELIEEPDIGEERPARTTRHAPDHTLITTSIHVYPLNRTCPIATTRARASARGLGPSYKAPRCQALNARFAERHAQPIVALAGLRSGLQRRCLECGTSSLMLCPNPSQTTDLTLRARPAHP